MITSWEGKCIFLLCGEIRINSIDNIILIIMIYNDLKVNKEDLKYKSSHEL